jgi:sugar phosphate isomerase/epimerase
MFWSVDGFPRIVNGTSTFMPRPLLRMRRAMRRFPDRASVDFLRSLGVRTVVVHPGLERIPFPPAGRETVRGGSAAAIASRPVRGLAVHRERVRGALVYRLAPRAPRHGEGGRQ